MHPFEECLKLSLGPCMPAATAVLFCLALGAVSGAAPYPTRIDVGLKGEILPRSRASRAELCSALPVSRVGIK
jgi:hypothetical protein